MTDEPGFYKDGEFGIRIENALYVTEATTKYALPEGTKFLKVIFITQLITLFEGSKFVNKISF